MHFFLHFVRPKVCHRIGNNDRSIDGNKDEVRGGVDGGDMGRKKQRAGEMWIGLGWGMDVNRCG